MSLIRSTYLGGSPKWVISEIRPSCESLSNAMDQSKKSMCRGELVASNNSCTRLKTCMGSLVDLDFEIHTVWRKGAGPCV